jgi:hypothetical protein
MKEIPKNYRELVNLEIMRTPQSTDSDQESEAEDLV